MASQGSKPPQEVRTYVIFGGKVGPSPETSTMTLYLQEQTNIVQAEYVGELGGKVVTDGSGPPALSLGTWTLASV